MYVGGAGVGLVAGSSVAGLPAGGLRARVCVCVKGHKENIAHCVCVCVCAPVAAAWPGVPSVRNARQQATSLPASQRRVGAVSPAFYPLRSHALTSKLGC